MENSTIFSLIFGSSTTTPKTITTTASTTVSPIIKTITENIIINNNNNDNENTVTSQLIISPSSLSSSASSLLNIINNSGNIGKNELTTNGLADIITTETIPNGIGSVVSGDSAAAAAIDLWNDQQITFEIPSSNDLEKINNLDNFTNLFHRIINNAQQQQQHNNIIDNSNNNNNNRLFTTQFDTNGSPVINLADLKTNYDNNGISIADDLFNLNNFNGNNHNILLNDNNNNNYNNNSLENLLFGNINMQNLINYLWIGVVTSLIILSVIFIIFSCYFYRKFKEWKKCNKDIRSQMTSSEFYHAQYGPNNNGITVCNGRVGNGGTNETGYYQMESPPCYTIATGLPTYDEALLYYTNNHHPHHHHLLLHHKNNNDHHHHHHQYQKSLQCGNEYDKHKEFNYIYINESPTSNLSENSFTNTTLATTTTTTNPDINRENLNSMNINDENQLLQISHSNETVNNSDGVIKFYYATELSSSIDNENSSIYNQNQSNHQQQQQQQQQQLQQKLEKHSNNIEKNKSCLKHQYSLQQQQQQDFQMTESFNLNSPPQINSPGVIFNSNNVNDNATTVLIKETNFQHNHPISKLSSTTLLAANEIEEIENCNNSNLNSESIDFVVISCPIPLTNDNNYDKISSNSLFLMEDEKENSNLNLSLNKSHSNNNINNNSNINSYNNNNNNNSYNSNLKIIKNENINLEGNCTDIMVMP